MNTYFTKENDKSNVILFLHGWGCDHSIFDFYLKNMSHSTNVSIDFWGFGKSAPPKTERMTIFDYSKALFEFLNEENFKKVSIVCHSFGARVGLVFCALHPEMVEKLVVIAGAGLRRFSLKRELKILFYKVTKNAKFGSKDFNDAQTEFLKNTLKSVTKEDLSKYAKKVVCPTLLLYGKKDDQTPLWIGKKLKRLIKNSRLEVFKQGNHFLFLQYNKTIMDMLEDFLID